MLDPKKAKKIRARKSYKDFEKMAEVAKTGDTGAILTELYNILDSRYCYGSIKNSMYAEESLELIKKDLNLGNNGTDK